MGTQIGIQMIEMYVKMVNEQFAPLINEVEGNEDQLKEVVKDQLFQELGINKLEAEKAALQLKLDRLNDKIDKYTGTSWQNGKYVKLIDHLVNIEVEKLNGVGTQIRDAKTAMVNQVKMIGAVADVQKAFAELPGIISGLAKKVKAIPVKNRVLLTKKVGSSKK